MAPLTGIGAGKLLLFGEHAAVYGYPAVGLALPLRTTITFTPSRAERFRGVSGEDAPVLRDLFGHIEGLVPSFRNRPPGDWSLESTLPRGVGFGSSAAVCAALAGILTSMEHRDGPPVTSERIWGMANDIERFFHGTPSGIDTGLSVLGGLRGFLPDPPGLPKVEEIGAGPLSLVVGSTIRDGNTRSLVASVRERMERRVPAVRSAIEGLGSIAESAMVVLSGNDGERTEILGELADRAHELLGALALGHPEVDAIISMEREGGAAGGKISGAGGGGAFYLVYPTPEAAVEGCTRLASGGRSLTFLAAVRWDGSASRFIGGPGSVPRG